MRIPLIFLTLFLASCASSPGGQVAANSDSKLLRTCVALAVDFRRMVENEKVGNASYPASPVAPFLHSSRFYDALVAGVDNDLHARELLTKLARLGDNSRRSENRNLATPWNDEQLNAISRCSFEIATSTAQAELRQALIADLQTQATVADHYSSLPQWLGAYSLLRPILRWRMDLLHGDERQWMQARENFQQAVSYEPAFVSARVSARDDASEWLAQAYAASPLGIPSLPEEKLQELFIRHAPSLTVETLGDHDHIGTIALNGTTPIVNTDHAVAYTRASYTRFGARNLLQLNYVFWLPAREPRSLLDLYAGDFDSLIWRVTLDHDGQVLLYDSIHSCGCYHKYFIASDALSIKSNPDSAEPANIFDLSAFNHRQGLHLSITANEHFIVEVQQSLQGAHKRYQMLPYENLYNLNDGEYSQSLFDANGILKGSERLERFTLWPTGIRNVGAMRQWGTHATGFVERQHFDDATLLDSYFELMR